MSWLIPPNELTPEQQRAVQLDPKEHRAIVGGPGSGKTQILLHRARHLFSKNNVSKDGFLIIVYTNVLKDYIKSALKDLNLSEEVVITFDNWCSTYYKKSINSKIPWDSTSKSPDYEKIRKEVMKHAAPQGPFYEFILVDEGQDLPEEAFSFFAKISRHVTVCLDNKQQIYDYGSSESGILLSLGIRRRNINLIEAFRVCPYLVDVAAHLIPDTAEREAFRNQTRQAQTEKQTPLIYFAKDFEAEKEMLHEMVRERLLKNERIAILLPQKRQVFGFAQGLSEVGIDVEVPAQRARGQSLPTHDFNSPRPKLMSYHSAKGLTFDSVFMPRLVARSFPHTTADRLERLLFVAITRATQWCFMSTSMDNPLPFLMNKLVPLQEERLVTVMEGRNAAHSSASKPSTPTKKESGLDFL
jgi:superfamily I DNA/RNA helicase